MNSFPNRLTSIAGHASALRFLLNGILPKYYSWLLSYKLGTVISLVYMEVLHSIYATGVGIVHRQNTSNIFLSAITDDARSFLFRIGSSRNGQQGHELPLFAFILKTPIKSTKSARNVAKFLIETNSFL